MSLTVVAYIKSKAGKETEVEQTLRGLIPPTRSEAGCINYNLHRSQDDEGLFMFYENWISREALDQHLATPYLQAFLSKVDQLLDRPVDIQLFGKLD
jgi:quinol monooxygenase YgiN